MKNKYYGITFCLAMIVLSANLQAQEIMRLSPAQAVDLAIKNNLGLESSRANLAARKRASDLSWNQFIPNVSVAGILNRDNQPNTLTGLAHVPWDDRFALMGLNQGQFELSVPTIGTFYNYVMPYSIELPQWRVAGNIQASLNISIAMFENIKRLRLDYETGLLSYDKAKRQLERDVRKAYHNMLLLQENIALLHSSFANLERQVQMAQANYNAGLAPELVLLQVRVARENMRPIIDQAENGMKLSMAQFAMFLGLDFNTQFELIPIAGNVIQGDFIPIDVTEMIKQAASKKPDIQELRSTIMMLQSARKMSIYSLAPVLNLSWNNTSAFIKDPWKDNWFSSADDWRHSGSFSITFALRLHSLIPFSTDFQGIRNLDDQIKTATIGLAQLVYGTEIEVYNSVLALERTRINTEALSQTVGLAQQSYRLTEQAYQAGLQDYFQVQNAEQSLRQARVQLLEQQFNYLNGLIDLEYSIGVPFGTLSNMAVNSREN
ncbi:MAG: TolC family protein [Treponema sp.]|nr:TolC family protein [Treponema sp.]